MAGLEQHHGQTGLDQTSMQPLGERAGLQPDLGEGQVKLQKEPHQRVGLTQHLGFTHDLTLIIDNADAALFQ
jgi:hypothetical protein